ncbi:Cadherin-23 Otocadherin [Takifugu flavidus]|uniref:Cadherin-23 Otocadherin n=1 Tax=Takifugu flavidus TaxID=433684 RepID=A0A5C6PFI8_9TELE|nr:Cadherin-23 Otocadherin [Takifugu flavidus]
MSSMYALIGGRRSPFFNRSPPTTQRDARMMSSIAMVNASGEMDNFLIYTVASASAFAGYFSIIMVDGYAVISVTRPLDYEQVPNGMIHLTVMAKDGGIPALNSTVPITVEVIKLWEPQVDQHSESGAIYWVGKVSLAPPGRMELGL